MILFQVFGIVLFILLPIIQGGSNEKQGIIMCAGPGDIFLEAIAMIEHMQHAGFTKTKVLIAHCDELPPSTQQIFSVYSNVGELNLCLNPINRGIKSRLAGFFCKPAALLASPFEQTMIVDTDVIWFDDPDKLFNSSEFVRSGALFFRDRWTQTRNKLTLTGGTHHGKHLHDYILQLAGVLPKETSRRLQERHPKHGPQKMVPISDHRYQALRPDHLAQTNPYWRHMAHGSGLSLDHWQDSSVLLMDSASHPRTLSLLRHILPSFNIGYGDKEMYWIAATAAGEDFSFEPNLAGSLGDCGALVHFDPNSHPLAESHPAAPFYINAEYLIDLKKIGRVGEFLDVNLDILHGSQQAQVKADTMITIPIRMNINSTALFALNPWKNMKHGFYPCSACSHATCVKAPDVVLHEIKTRQKLLLLLKSSQKSSDSESYNLDWLKSVRSKITPDYFNVL